VQLFFYVASVGGFSAECQLAHCFKSVWSYQVYSAFRKFYFFLPLFLVACHGEPPKMNMPPPQVTVTPAIERDLPIYVEAIGQTRGSKEVQIQPRVSGFLQSQDYKDGALVRAGSCCTPSIRGRT